MTQPVLVFTQGDPAGIGPEILLQLAGDQHDGWRPLVIAQRAALEALRQVLPHAAWSRLHYLDDTPDRQLLDRLDEGVVPVFDPTAGTSTVVPGQPDGYGARAALAALDLGALLVRRSVGDALVTAPLAKDQIAHHVTPDFRGHTDYLAAGAGLEHYGRDYLMAFLAPHLRVALLSTHIPLARAIDELSSDAIVDALRCLDRHAARGRRIAVAGLNPHAGEGGLLGTEDDAIVAPAVARARAEGIDASGPSSADSLFARAARGAADWVLALYHDQGLIAVKTAAFGDATNWTVGLPYLRTSVDHGTAFDIAGRGEADASSLRAVVVRTLELLAERVSAGGSLPATGC